MESIQIEITNICNFNCVYCPRPYLKRKSSHLNMETFDTIFNMFSNHKCFILNKDGEPFLNPNIKTMIEKLGEDKFLHIPTNAVYLTKDIIDFLVERKNSIKLVITEHILGRENQKDDVMNKSRPNILYLLEKKKNNIEVCLLRHHIDGYQNEDEEFKNYYSELQKKYNISQFTVNTDIDKWCDQVHLNNNKKKRSCVYGGMGLITIGVTGNVLLCCTDLNEECILGNVFTNTKEEIMKKRKSIYYKINTNNWDDLSPCNRCLTKK